MPRAIDHLVLAVADLDAAARFYDRLGFQVGARNRHPWGTENRLIQFDGAFLELVTVADAVLIPDHGPGRFSFGAFVRDRLAGLGEGLAMLALTSADASADQAAFAQAGIGTGDAFHFERKGIGPDGREVRVAFSLAFARDPSAPDAGYFVCQHHTPETFWNRKAQSHASGATGIVSVVAVCENPTDHHIALQAFTGIRAPRATSRGVSFELADGACLDLLDGTAAGQVFGAGSLPSLTDGAFGGFVMSVPDPAALAARLSRSGTTHVTIGQRVVVPASAAHGAAIAFQAG